MSEQNENKLLKPSAACLSLAAFASLSGDQWLLHKEHGPGLTLQEDGGLILALFIDEPEEPRWVRQQDTRLIPVNVMQALVSRFGPEHWSHEKSLIMPTPPRPPRDEDASQRQVRALKKFGQTIYMKETKSLRNYERHDDSDKPRKTFTGARMRLDQEGVWRDRKGNPAVLLAREERGHKQKVSQGTKLKVDSHWNTNVKVGKRYTNEVQRQITQAPRDESEKGRDDLRNCALFFGEGLTLVDQQAAELLRSLLAGCTAEQYRSIRGLSTRRIRLVKDHIAKYFPTLKLYPLKQHGVLLAGSKESVAS
jgi:hypothetical protein